MRGWREEDIANLSRVSYQGEGVSSRAFTNKLSLSSNQPKIPSDPQSCSKIHRQKYLELLLFSKITVKERLSHK